MEFDIFYYENDISMIKDNNNPRIILNDPSVFQVLSDIINCLPNSIDINQYPNKEIINRLLTIEVIKYSYIYRKRLTYFKTIYFAC